MKYSAKNTLATVVLVSIMIISSCKKSDEGGASLPVITTPDPHIALVLKDVAYGADSLQKVDIYLPANRSIDSTKILYLIHGGAWTAGDKKDFDSNVIVFQTLLPQYAFVNINYRLATTTGINEWPTQMNDVNAAIDYVMNKSSYYQIDNAKSAVFGASAGAQLALLKGYNFNSNHSIKAVVDLFGPTDMIDLYNHPANPAYPTLLQIFMSGTPTSNNSNYLSGSPLYSVNTSVPPTIIFHGTADNTVPIHQSDSLNLRLKNAGVIKQYITYTGEGHGWVGNNLIDTYNKAAAFLVANNK